MKKLYPNGRMESDILRVPVSGVWTGRQVSDESLLTIRCMTDRTYSATARHKNEAKRNANAPLTLPKAAVYAQTEPGLWYRYHKPSAL